MRERCARLFPGDPKAGRTHCPHQHPATGVITCCHCGLVVHWDATAGEYRTALETTPPAVGTQEGNANG